MRVSIDPKNPPLKEKISAAELRKRIAESLVNMSDDQFQSILDDNGISAVVFLGKDDHDLRRSGDEYELTTYHPKQQP